MVPPSRSSGWSNPGQNPKQVQVPWSFLGEDHLLAVVQESRELLDTLDVVLECAAAQVADLALHVHRDLWLVLDDVERLRQVLAHFAPLYRVEEALADDAAQAGSP